MSELRFPNEGSFPEFLAALASPEGTHGVVSAAAVAAAMGASLLQMVATLPQTLLEDRCSQLDCSSDRRLKAGEHDGGIVLETIETETAVKLFAARNMPHSGEAERVPHPPIWGWQSRCSRPLSTARVPVSRPSCPASPTPCT